MIDARLPECRHAAVEGTCGFDDRKGEEAPGRLAEAEPEIEQRLESELAEHEVVSRFGGAVARDQRFADGGLESYGEQRGGGDRIAVDDDREAPPCAFGCSADEGCEFQAAEGGESGIGSEIGTVKRERGSDDAALAPEPGRVDTGATADGAICGLTGEGRDERRRGRSVADADLAENEAIDATIGEFACEARPRRDCERELVTAERRSPRHVRGSFCDLLGANGFGSGTEQPDICHHQLVATVPGKHAYRRLAACRRGCNLG